MKKEIKLNELVLRNFKGIQEFHLKAEGEDVRIFGDNATGKTTLFDGFIWLLFGKDSQNKTDFEIKSLDASGNVKQHGLNHEVEASFKIEGKTISLKRVFAEKWTKKRGSSESKFSGHSTEYFLDDVPVQKKEYTEKVNEIVSEDVFKLLTNPSYFNKQLKWNERRDILLNMAGDVTDEEVAENSDNKDLASFIENLDGRAIEDHKKVINQKKKKVNEELDRIPIRIDELNRSLPDISSLDQDKLKTVADDLIAKINKSQERISDIKSGGEISNKRKEISDIELKISELRNDHEYEEKQSVYRTKASIQETESNIKLLENKVEAFHDTEKANMRRISDLDNDVQCLREEWQKVNETSFSHNDQCECPTCGQSLPEDQVNATREKALEQFNLDKSEKLEKITAQAKRKKEEVDKLKDANARDNSKKEKLQTEINDLKEKLIKLKERLESEQEVVSDITENPKYLELIKQKKAIESEIKSLQDSKDEEVLSVREEIKEMQQEQAKVQDDLNKFEQAKRGNSRLEELEQQEKDLAAEYEELEKQMYLTEVFTRNKVKLLEEKINSKFKYATFKLFDQQINGGLKETCETLYEGIPYNSGLNNAAQINVGLDIINTLNDYYEVSAPIFIDNSESVTRLIDTEAQTISLVVSENHSKLEIA